MKKVLLTFIFLFCSVASHAAERIISLKPNITEIIYALHAEEKLVGVTTYCNRPEAATKLPQVADYLAPSVEKVVALQPDLLLTAQENGEAAPVLRLQSLGYKVAFYKFDRVQDTLSSIEAIGRDLHREKPARELSKNLQNTLQQVQARAPTQKPRVLFLLSAQPLIAVGANTLFSELIAIAGGENVLGKNKTHWPRLNEENLLQLQPEIIFTLYMDEQQDAALWKKFPQIFAVQQKNIYHLNPDDFRAGPNLANAASTLQKLIYASAHP